MIFKRARCLYFILRYWNAIGRFVAGLWHPPLYFEKNAYWLLFVHEFGKGPGYMSSDERLS
jgi:hypothetical protein